MKLEKYLEDNGIQKSVFAESIGETSVRLSKILHGRIKIDLETAHEIHKKTEGKVTFTDWLPENKGT